MSREYTVYYSLTKMQERRLIKLAGAYNKSQGTNHTAPDFFRRMMGINCRLEIDRKLEELEKLYMN